MTDMRQNWETHVPSFEGDIPIADIENLDRFDELDLVEKSLDDGIEADDIDDSL